MLSTPLDSNTKYNPPADAPGKPKGNARARAACVHAIRNAAKPEDGSLIAGGYALSDTHAIPVHAEPSIYRDTKKQRRELTLLPKLKKGVDPNKQKFTVDDFDIYKPQGNNLILHVYTSPPTKDSAGKPQTDFKWDFKTRAFSHGSKFRGPKTGPDGKQFARINRVCREGLLWVREHVEGCEDIFVENTKVVSRYLGSEEPPIVVPDEQTHADIQAQRPGGRPTQAGSAASKKRILEAEIVETRDEEKKAASKSTKQPQTMEAIKDLLAAEVTFRATNNQGVISVEVKAPAVIAEQFADKFQTIAIALMNGGIAQLKESLPGSMLVEPQRLLDFFDQQHMDTESMLEQVIRYASHDKIFPGRPGYEKAVKYVERFVSLLNRKEPLDGLPDVVVDYMLVTDVGLVDRGVSSEAATQPVGAGRVFRKVPDTPIPEPVQSNAVETSK